MTNYSRRATLELIGGTGLLLAGAGTAAAKPNNQPRNFRTHLTGDEEVPPVDTKAQGQATFKFAKDMSEVGFKLNVANIVDVVASHIHLAPAGQNGGVVVPLYSGVPAGRTQGTLAEGTIVAGDLVGSLAGMTLADLKAAMMAGDTYVNVHTLANPPGEIRGQIF